MTRLETLRKRARLTRYELAKYAGLSPTAVQGIERGETPNPKLSTLEKLSDALAPYLGMSHQDVLAVLVGIDQANAEKATDSAAA